MTLSASPARRQLRARFNETSASTASPARLVTMLYDRLLRDMNEGAAALEAGDHARAHHALVHAQDIVSALRQALDPDVWPAARTLGELYDFVLDRLVVANVRKDASAVTAAREVIEPLGSAWHEAFRGLHVS